MESAPANDRIPDAAVRRGRTGLTSGPGVVRRLAKSFRSPRPRRLAVPAAVVALLSAHAGLLAYTATRHSPTLNEPGHLAAGLAMWEFGRFEVYRVNPPLTRLVAALPVLAAGYEMNWTPFRGSPGARPEFALGEAFVRANGERSVWLFTLARWACIPFSLIGGLFCFLWGRELYGAAAGLASLTIWCSDPNILAHAELITPDAAATAFGVGASYAFWRWLKAPTWSRAAVAGLLLGLAQLTKMSWLLLFGLWPLLWVVWRASGHQPPGPNGQRQVGQFAAILLLGLYVLHLGYAFDGSLVPLKEFVFVSEALAGKEHAGEGGNRFAGSGLGKLPVPLPRQYLLGLDAQKRDFEDYDQPSYLRGRWRDRGWWYYYLYGLLVKVPHGTQGLFLLTAGLTLLAPRLASWRDELVLLAPAVCLFALVSSQTEFSHHFRYVLPSLGILLIFLGKPILALTGGLAQYVELRSWGEPSMRRRAFETLTRQSLAALAVLCLAGSAASSLRVYPHSLAYFNEMAGGPENGYRHMLGSNLDWGQDLLVIRSLSAAMPRQKLFASVNAFYDLRDLGARCDAWDGGSSTNLRRDFGVQGSGDWPEGVYVVSVDRLIDAEGTWDDVPLSGGRTLASTDMESLTRLSPGLFLFQVSREPVRRETRWR